MGARNSETGGCGFTRTASSFEWRRARTGGSVPTTGCRRSVTRRDAVIFYAGEKVLYDKEEIDALIANLQAMLENADVDTVSDKLVAMQALLDETLAAYSDKLDDFQETINEALAAVESAVSTASEAQSTVESLSSAVTVLQSNVSELQSRTASLESRVTATEGDIADIKEEIEAIKDKIAGVFTVKGSAKYVSEDAVDETFTAAGLWQETDGVWTLVTSIDAGDVYNLLEDITTDSGFLEGSGNNVSAGTNVVFVNIGTDDEPVWKLDVLALSITSVEMDAEIATREAEIARLEALLESETARAQAAESALQDNLDEETSGRQTADSELQSSIEAEVSRAQEAESQLMEAVSAENKRALKAELALNERIDELDESKAEAWTGDAAEFESERDSLADGTLVLSESDLNH